MSGPGPYDPNFNDQNQYNNQYQPYQYGQPYPYPNQQKKKGNPWMIVACVAIVLLLVTNAYWVIASNPSVLDGTEDDSGAAYLKLVRMDSTTADYYQTLREEVGPQSASWSSRGSDWDDDVQFCANLAKHDIGAVYWETYDDYYFEAKGTHAYDDAHNELLEILALAGVKSTDDDITQMVKILDFINLNVDYASDLEDKFFAPVETLAYGSGDCDDYSILAAALFELVGVDSAVAFFSNNLDEGHAMTLVHLDDLGDYGYYYYDDLTTIGLQAGNWIIIEPQDLISAQDDPQWTGQWDVEVAAET
ncbi:MAG: hypothetical protein NT131_08060 [Methanomassiliicoccales archaeon]|nr:hypothetical protein [Methanomassiliicoccales archaeon]